MRKLNNVMNVFKMQKNNEYIDPDKEEMELYERLKKKYEKS